MIYKPSPTSERFMFEHDESLRADLLPINFPAKPKRSPIPKIIPKRSTVTITTFATVLGLIDPSIMGFMFIPKPLLLDIYADEGKPC